MRVCWVTSGWFPLFCHYQQWQNEYFFQHLLWEHRQSPSARWSIFQHHQRISSWEQTHSSYSTTAQTVFPEKSLVQNSGLCLLHGMPHVQCPNPPKKKKIKLPAQEGVLQLYTALNTPWGVSQLHPWLLPTEKYRMSSCCLIVMALAENWNFFLDLIFIHFFFLLGHSLFAMI